MLFSDFSHVINKWKKGEIFFAIPNYANKTSVNVLLIRLIKEFFFKKADEKCCKKVGRGAKITRIYFPKKRKM